FEKPWNAWVVFRTAGPEHTHLLLHFVVGDPGIIRDASARSTPEFIKYFFRAVERKPVSAPQRRSDILNDSLILPGSSRAVDRLVDFDHSAFRGGHQAFVFLVQGTRQHKIRVLRCFTEKEIDRDKEFQLFEHLANKSVIRKGYNRIKADRKKTADFIRFDFPEHLIAIDTRGRHFLFGDSPNVCDVGAVFGIGNVASPRKLIAFLSVFAASLAISLPRDGGVSASGSADPARGEHDVDGAQNVLNAVRVMLNSAGVHQKTSFCSPPP